jgi:hypothetical protein
LLHIGRHPFAHSALVILPSFRFPRLKRIFYYDFVPYAESTHVAIINFDEVMTICKIEEEEIHFSEENSQRMKVFTNRYLKFVINEGVAEALVFDGKSRIMRITSSKDVNGLNDSEVSKLRNCYGQGAMEIERPTWYFILLNEMIRPLYLFLFFSVALWFYELYNIYASIILGTSLIAIGLTVYELVTLNNKIHNMAFYEVNLHALR